MKSIRQQLTWQLLVLMAAVSLTGGVGTYLYVRHALKRQFDDGLRAKALAMTRLVAWSIEGKLMLEIPQDELAEFRHSTRPDYFEVWLPNGKVFAKADSLKGGDLPFTATKPGVDVCENLVLPDGRIGRVVTTSFIPHSEADEPQESGAAAHAVPHDPGPLTLKFATDRVEIDRGLAHLSEGLIVVWGSMTLLTAAVLAVTVRRGLRPLEQLSDEAERFHSESLHSRFSTENLPAELSPIVERLNALLQRIEGAFDRERRFTADAAHELRTPIAELRSLAEVIIKWPRDRGDARREFTEVLTIARQMERLVESLLAMGRCANRQQQVETQLELLAPLLWEAWRGCESRAVKRGLNIKWEIAEDLQVQTDRALLMPILRNILSNAAEYSPPGREIECKAQTTAEGVELRVLNGALDLDAADITHIFEPFWRKDRSRTGTDHSGLGLAVASEYAQILNIQLQASLTPDDRFEMRVLFPRVAAQTESQGVTVPMPQVSRRI